MRGRCRHRAVERELADRDTQSAGALIAKPEDPLAVRDNDRIDILARPAAEDLHQTVAGYERNRPRLRR